jgi:GNAT superfamily N-acetyltransferase
VIAAPRLATADDIPPMQAVERAAGALFAGIGMHDVANDAPLPTETLGRYTADGRAWVVADGERVVGYILADIVDGLAHIEQLSVHPEFGRRGIGRALVETVIAWARSHRLPAVTLLTFRAVPWNAPYYARLGFRPLEDSSLGPELRRLREHERELGLDVDARCAMRREIAVEASNSVDY